jgi:hypothetical protein
MKKINTFLEENKTRKETLGEMLRYSARIQYIQLRLPLQVLRWTHHTSKRIFSVIELRVNYTIRTKNMVNKRSTLQRKDNFILSFKNIYRNSTR